MAKLRLVYTAPTIGPNDVIREAIRLLNLFAYDARVEGDEAQAKRCIEALKKLLKDH